MDPLKDGPQPPPTVEEETISFQHYREFQGLDPKGDEPGHSSDNLQDADQ